jgi:membrane complex biogenesis BtpA family protein
MKNLFEVGRKVLLGVMHLKPLPGSPRWRKMPDLEKVIALAVRDARAYEQGGADGVFIENFWDAPFTKGHVAPETLAAMAAAGRAIREAVDIPIGFNVLRNDALAGLALCTACGGSYIRVNVHTGAMLTDQGIIEGNAYETLRCRTRLCPEVLIFGDVHVKHAVPLGSWAIEDSARDTVERGLADALIVSGVGTGLATDVKDVERVRQACPTARILIGSGTTAANAGDYLRFADGCIVGSSLKKNGDVANPVDPRRVAALAQVLAKATRTTPARSLGRGKSVSGTKAKARL